MITILLVLCIVHNIGKAQTSTSESKDLRYGLIAEFGPYFGYQNFGGTSIFVNNIVLKEKFLFGLGVGMEVETADNFAIPLFFNFRHYFPSRPGKSLRPLVNIALGTRICVKEDYRDVMYINEWGDVYYLTESYGTKALPGFYSTVATGFKAGFFTFTAGMYFKTGDIFSAGAEVKCGFTF